jgi:hypothetical protein
MSADTEALRQLFRAASAGPWDACGAERGGCQCGLIWSKTADHLVLCARPHADDMATPSLEQSKANAILITAVVNALPDLLDELDRLRNARGPEVVR